MTIIVGIVGTDGVVLAADQRRVLSASKPDEYDDLMGMSKIVNLERHNVAYAGAGDAITRRVGQELAARLDNGTFRFDSEKDLLRLSLEQIATDTIRGAFPGRDLPNGFDCEHRSMVIVNYGSSAPQLWHLTIRSNWPSAEFVRQMTITGAIGNGARFFQHYFRESTPIRLLTLLAAHTVLTAGRIDNLMIDGLDVALFDANGYSLLSEDEKDVLREKSATLDASIREQLFAAP